MIRTKTAYVYSGKDFSSLPAVKKQVEAELGKFIDGISVGFDARMKLAVFNWLLTNRNDLTRLLNTTFETEQGNELSIFSVE